MNNPVAWVYPDFFENLEKFHVWSAYKENFDSRIPLYTHPMRELTDEEILEIASPMFVDVRYPSTALEFARAILKKAREK